MIDAILLPLPIPLSPFCYSLFFRVNVLLSVPIVFTIYVFLGYISTLSKFTFHMCVNWGRQDFNFLFLFYICCSLLYFLALCCRTFGSICSLF